MLFSPSSIWQLRCRSPPWSRAAGLPGSTWHTDGRWEGHSRIQPAGRREGREKKTWLQNQQRWLDTELLWKRVSFAAALQFSCGYTLIQWNETDCIPLCNELICNHAQLCESLFNTRRITIWFIFNPIWRRHREVLLSCISCWKLVVQTLINTKDVSDKVVMKQGESHQRCVARVVWVDWTGSRGVHVAEQTLDLPQRDSASSVRHLKIKEWYVKNHQGPLIVLSAGSLQSSVTLIVRSSLPSETRTLIGGSVGLVSWVSTVALMAFWQRTITVDENITEQTHGGG